MKSIAVSFALLDWWTDWFGETSGVQWIGLFIAALLAGAVACGIYLSLLKRHLQANRYPSALRSFCLVLGLATLLGIFTMIFYGAFIYYISGVLAVILLIVAIVFFVNGQKIATK